MPPDIASWLTLARRFLTDESGGAGLQYVLFTVCWSACISGGLYFGTPLMTTKLDAVSAAVRGNAFR